MDSSNLENVNVDSNIKVVNTDSGVKDGQDKCPKCGATEISLNINTGKLRCHFCRHEFMPQKISGLEEDISKLNSEIITSGASDIIASDDDVKTLKCSSCGAEVVIDTASATQARCHWCRNMLSINSQIPNGAIPDVVLPFKVSKEEARKYIHTFVGKRKFFANTKFKAEFKTDNIMGVYFPYMIADVNAHINLSGKGEHLVRKYTRGSDENRETYYDADEYNVEREFDIAIMGLTIESNKDRLNKDANDKTNNIINAIMPFDVENCAKYNANYLRGFTSEKRDANVFELKGVVGRQAHDVALFSANETLDFYDRGVAWKTDNFEIKGQQYQTAYLPVWLYSYQEVTNSKKMLHYVAVNARTMETMGSVPINMPKLFLMSFLVEFLGFIGFIFTLDDIEYGWLFLLSGVIYFFIMYGRYRNNDARHVHETETKSKRDNLRKVDDFVTSKKGLRNSRIEGANNTKIGGKNISNNIISNLVDNSVIGTIKDDIARAKK